MPRFSQEVALDFRAAAARIASDWHAASVVAAKWEIPWESRAAGVWI